MLVGIKVDMATDGPRAQSSTYVEYIAALGFHFREGGYMDDTHVTSQESYKCRLEDHSSSFWSVLLHDLR